MTEPKHRLTLILDLNPGHDSSSVTETVVELLQQHTAALLEPTSGVGGKAQGSQVCRRGVVEWCFDDISGGVYQKWAAEQNRKRDEYEARYQQIYRDAKSRQNLREQLMSPKPRVTVRNRRIYSAWKNGNTFKALSQEYGITAGRINRICIKLAKLEARAV